jgi:hypothetical protein
MEGEYTNSIIKTEHYSFVLQKTEEFSPIHQIKYIVGYEKKPCIEAYVLLPDNERLHELGFTNTAKLAKIDALIECAREDITNNYLEKYSFGTELLEYIINLISTTYPHITKISLNDTSHIPCNRKAQDELDLLTYSIAKYGKTWYEMKMNVHLESKVAQERYKKEINYYMSRELKSTITFKEILNILENNNFALKFIYSNISDYEKMYEMAQTLPEFFTKLSELVPRKDRCHFFKDWLENFIKQFIYVESYWIYDIRSPKRKNIGGSKRVTRKVNRH